MNEQPEDIDLAEEEGAEEEAPKNGGGKVETTITKKFIGTGKASKKTTTPKEDDALAALRSFADADEIWVRREGPAMWKGRRVQLGMIRARLHADDFRPGVIHDKLGGGDFAAKPKAAKEWTPFTLPGAPKDLELDESDAPTAPPPPVSYDPWGRPIQAPQPPPVPPWYAQPYGAPPWAWGGQGAHATADTDAKIEKAMKPVSDLVSKLAESVAKLAETFSSGSRKDDANATIRVAELRLEEAREETKRRSAELTAQNALKQQEINANRDIAIEQAKAFQAAQSKMAENNLDIARERMNSEKEHWTRLMDFQRDTNAKDDGDDLDKFEKMIRVAKLVNGKASGEYSQGEMIRDILNNAPKVIETLKAQPQVTPNPPQQIETAEMRERVQRYKEFMSALATVNDAIAKNSDPAVVAGLLKTHTPSVHGYIKAVTPTKLLMDVDALLADQNVGANEKAILSTFKQSATVEGPGQAFMVKLWQAVAAAT